MYTGEAVNKLPGFVYSKLFAWSYLLQMSKYQTFWMSGISQKKKGPFCLDGSLTKKKVRIGALLNPTPYSC